MDFAPTPLATLVETLLPTAAITSEVALQVPVVANVAICADCATTCGKAAMNFFISPSPISKFFFASSIVFGAAGSASSGTAIASDIFLIPAGGWIGLAGARVCNKLGKYAYAFGKTTNGTITPVDAAKLIGQMETNCA